MGIDQKIRSLHCGIPAGIKFTELDGRQVVKFRHMPFELEDLVMRWTWIIPDALRVEYIHESALTVAGWSAFVSWMVATLAEKLTALEQLQNAGFVRRMSNLTSSPT